jgi:transposase
MEGGVDTATRVRRYRSTEEKRRIVEAVAGSGESVSVMARRHGVNANQLFHWRKLYQAGLLGAAPREATRNELQLLSVAVSDTSVDEPSATPASSADRTGAIHIEFPGRALVSIEGQADPGTIRAVLETLRG